MKQICVYSRRPLSITEAEALEIKEAKEGGYYRYTLLSNPLEGQVFGAVPDFVFKALLQNIVENRLRIDKSLDSGADRRISSIFSQKLSAYLYITGNKSKIGDIISSLLAESSVINIDGVVTFRLREFSSDISAFFDLLFYEYNVQKQYDDFITLVRDYIRLESPREQEIHIVFERGAFTLYNTQKANVTGAALKKYRSDLWSKEGSLNDFLISSLLYYLPEKIIIHTEDAHLTADVKRAASGRIIDTIKTIFEKRVITCENGRCSLCGNAAGEEINNS